VGRLFERSDVDHFARVEDEGDATIAKHAASSNSA
jgi:hypothetical protein